MKKLLSYLLVIALVLVQFMPLVSAETTGSITITTPESETVNGAIDYNIYKVFDLSLATKEENGQETAVAYRYTIREDSPWYNFFTEGVGKDYVTLTESVPEEDENGVSKKVYVVTWKGADEENRKEVLAKAALAYAKEKGIAATKTATIAKDGTSTTVTGLELGYYLVDSSLGALVALTSTDKNATINEKNTPPTIDKTVKEGNNYGSTSNGQIGDTVEFKVEINAKKGAQNYVLTDTMDKGLTFNQDSIAVTVGTTTLTAGKDYTVTYPTGKTFEITFAEDYLEKITGNTQIVVTYSAIINENAVINDDGNVNSAQLKYGDNTKTEVDYTRTYVLAFELLKTDANNTQLDGAKFEVYRETESSPIEFVLVTENGVNYYRVATSNETGVTEIPVGKVYIKGLDEGTYYLKETVAPEGYNKLTDRIEVTLDDVEDSENSISHHTNLIEYESQTVKFNGDQVKVINTTGTLLPSTGGMGTVMFITVGSIMVLGFGVLLVTKLRISKMEI